MTDKEIENAIFDTFLKSAREYSNSSKMGGNIPRDTGLLQESIREQARFERTSLMVIGSDTVSKSTPYYASYLEYNEFVGMSSKTNKHRGFVESFILDEYVKALGKLGKVTVK